MWIEILRAWLLAVAIVGSIVFVVTALEIKEKGARK